jgi:non-heme chloroperoxidase
MRLSTLWITATSVLLACALHAQDLTGTWQGTLKADRNLRMIIQIEKSSTRGRKVKFYSIDEPDQATDPRAVASFAFHDLTVEFSLDQDAGSFQGTLNAARNTISGSWNHGKALPLEFVRANKQSAWQIDPTAHRVQFISVEKDVQLEVLDWGGSGRPLILLPGLGDTAHVFDQFALKLIPTYHVYGITPRGFGASSCPPPEAVNYSADRLGDDIVAVIDALKLEQPILAGHSVAGEELSSIGTRHSEKVAALIYIDAGYSYALYDKAHGDVVLDSIALRNRLEQIRLGILPRTPNQLDELLTETTQLQQSLQQRKEDFSRISTPHPIGDPVSVAVLDGEQRYTNFELPVLTIFNVPHSPVFLRTMESQAAAFNAQIPHVKVVRIPQADHYLFQSNEADVLREINVFIGGLHTGNTAASAISATTASR